MKVVVLGCGPAGLLAAYAARREFDAEVTVLSVKKKSQLFGCQYLHEPIPGLNENRDGHFVKYELRGDVQSYRAKVYSNLSLTVSPQHLVGDHYAWDLRAAYDTLWEMFEPYIDNVKVGVQDVAPISTAYGADLIISSIPAKNLCHPEAKHAFSSVKCWAVGDAPELDKQVLHYAVPEFSVICDGTADVAWYRASNVFGHATIEWPGHRPPVEGVSSFEKPLSTDCDCLTDVLRVGRYGRWVKGVLSHEAYGDTVRRMAKLV